MNKGYKAQENLLWEIHQKLVGKGYVNSTPGKYALDKGDVFEGVSEPFTTIEWIRLEMRDSKKYFYYIHIVYPREDQKLGMPTIYFKTDSETIKSFKQELGVNGCLDKDLEEKIGQFAGREKAYEFLNKL